MKIRIALLISCFALLASPAFAEERMLLSRSNPYVLGAGAAAAATCNTTEQSATNVSGSEANCAYSAGTVYCSTKFTTDGDGVAVCGIGVYIKKNNSPTMTLTVQVWTDSTGPSTKVADCGTIDASTLPTSFTETKVTCSSTINLSASTAYWVVIQASETHFSNYYKWGNGDFGGGSMYIADITPTWSEDATRTGGHAIYK